MKGLISIYLDIFRFLAAVGVFMSHAQQHSAAYGVLPQVYFDHKLVIFFFVISGYVIAATASRPGQNLAIYSADRLARLSSVVIPALILTCLLDGIGSRVTPEVYSDLNPNWQPVRFLANFFYVQQIWKLCVIAGSNNPLWSLGYEFWYYAIFGIWAFVVPKGTKWFWLLGIALFIGPKILLLLPAWIVGAMAFYAVQKYRFSFKTSLTLFVGTGAVTLFCLLFAVQLHLTNGQVGVLPTDKNDFPLFYSADFIGDNIFAVVVALHFFACAVFSKHLKTDFEPYRIVKFIRWAASHTFSLYVYHMPLLYFVRAIGRYDKHNLSAVLLALAVVLLIVAGLSKITEERYPVLRNYLRQRFGSATAKLQPAVIK